MDIEEAKDWLASIDVHSETEASYKELILSTLEALSKELKETKDNEYATNNIISDLLDDMEEVNDCWIYNTKLAREIILKDKIINKMAELLTKMPFYDNSGENIIMLNNKEEVIKYYEKKVEEENKNG